MELLKIVLCSYYFGIASCGSASYTAAVVEFTKADLISSDQYAALIHEAAQSNVDLMVLPTPRDESSKTILETCSNGLEHFDEFVKSVSAAAKDAQVYVVAPLYEKVNCHNGEELATRTLVFDRTGTLVSVHRKPVNSFSACNTTCSRFGRFTTDFGLTFGVVAEDDLILTNAQHIDGIKNFVVTDNVMSKRPFLFAKQFSSSWAFVNNVNVISASGMISSPDKLQRTSSLIVATLGKDGSGPSTLTAGPAAPFPREHFSQYVARPLDLEASGRGYSDSVCHGAFCCQFHIKTSTIGTDPQAVSYGLVAFAGIHQTGSGNVAVQTCSVVACAGLHETTCSIGSENSTTNIKFNEISVNANFSKENSAQFPTISTTTQTTLNKENLKFTIDSNQDYKFVSTKVSSIDNIITFGIIGRDYSKDFENTNYGNGEDQYVVALGQKVMVFYPLKDVAAFLSILSEFYLFIQTFLIVILTINY